MVLFVKRVGIIGGGAMGSQIADIMAINGKEVIIKDEGLETAKKIKAPNEYFEGTVRPDMDGKMKDIIEEIDEVDHLELKKIADELHADDFYYPLDAGKKLKASGGLAQMLGE